MNNEDNIFKKVISYLKNKKVILILIIILSIVTVVLLSSYSSTNIGEVEAQFSNLTLNYNNDKSNYYIEEVQTGKNIGDGYINKEEYDGVIILDLKNIQWKPTNESDIDFANDYYIEDLNDVINNPEKYTVSIKVYDNNANQVGSNLIGKDIKLRLNNNILTATVHSNHSSDITLTKNNCSNASYAVFELTYNNDDVNYTIISNLTDEKFNVIHI